MWTLYVVEVAHWDLCTKKNKKKAAEHVFLLLGRLLQGYIYIRLALILQMDRLFQIFSHSDEELKVYVQLSTIVSHQLPFDQGVHDHQSGF